MLLDFILNTTEVVQNATTNVPEVASFQGVDLYNSDFEKLVFRFLMNFLITLVIVRLLYYPSTKRKDYLFSFLLTSVIIFFICFALKKFEIKTGMALGLFAIFGIMRFRTTTMPIKEMTYLFIIIGVSVINALTSSKFSYAELAFINLSVIIAVFAIERIWLMKHEAQKEIVYEKIGLIKPEKQAELIADLENRTGIKIHRVEVGNINFLNDTAKITVFFFPQDQSVTYFRDDSTDPK